MELPATAAWAVAVAFTLEAAEDDLATTAATEDAPVVALVAAAEPLAEVTPWTCASTVELKVPVEPETLESKSDVKVPTETGMYAREHGGERLRGVRSVSGVLQVLRREAHEAVADYQHSDGRRIAD